LFYKHYEYADSELIKELLEHTCPKY